MNQNLENHVLWSEMSYVCGLDAKYAQEPGVFVTYKLGSHLYVDTKTIKDPLLAQEVYRCTPMNKFYPLGTLVEELGLTAHEERNLKKTEHVIKFYGVYLFVVPEEMFNNPTSNKSIIINLISCQEEEEGYETVVSIRSFFKIGKYTL